ncbi:flavodoxin [Gallaecimonas pentaromativorans]|uniref:Flavodoxin n=1 Tax=Gallaecimonas pentaromativorans TaxID=584787 RepID=A0A3N1PIR6_9GAMM|nr:flavodoxin [Gallaecimonas pentaromativorans]MED5524472.1 flavodoxin [Pseudomonadota bacterium]ROQ28483.1 flavodoxin [Gallaecimonas pentaromativorans]
MAIIHLVCGTVYGAAEQLAQTLEKKLNDSGHQAVLFADPTVAAVIYDKPDALLVVTSTTGQGDVPDNLVPFFIELKNTFPLLSQLPYGIITLGDSSYGDTYCGAGNQFEELLEELGGKALLPRLNIDSLETLEPEQEALPWLEQWSAAL